MLSQNQNFSIYTHHNRITISLTLEELKKKKKSKNIPGNFTQQKRKKRLE